MNKANNEINLRIEQIKSDLEFMTDWEEKFTYIIDIGRNLEKLSSDEMNDENKVRGCVSQVWLISEFLDGKLYFRGASDSTLVQGLVAVLINIYSGLTPSEIIEYPPEKALETLGLKEAVTPNRANGLKSMAVRILTLAKTY